MVRPGHLPDTWSSAHLVLCAMYCCRVIDALDTMLDRIELHAVLAQVGFVLGAQQETETGLTLLQQASAIFG